MWKYGSLIHLLVLASSCASRGQIPSFLLNFELRQRGAGQSRLRVYLSNLESVTYVSGSHRTPCLQFCQLVGCKAACPLCLGPPNDPSGGPWGVFTRTQDHLQYILPIQGLFISFVLYLTLQNLHQTEGRQLVQISQFWTSRFSKSFWI